MAFSPPTSTGVDMTPAKIDPGAERLVVIEARKRSLLRALAILLLIILPLLFLRIILEGAGANPLSIFAGTIDLTSGILMVPFFGIFPSVHDTTISGQPMFDTPALTAMFCYLVVILTLMGIVLLVSSIMKNSKQIDETKKEKTLTDATQVEHMVK